MAALHAEQQAPLLQNPARPCPSRPPLPSSLQVPYVQAPKIGEELDPEAVASGIKDRGIAEKLAAAARRRRERQAQQKGAAGEGIP